MIIKKSVQKGVSLIEVLVTLVVMSLVVTIILQNLFQMRSRHGDSVDRLKNNQSIIEAQAIFRNLIENAFISGNSNYLFSDVHNYFVGDEPQDVNPIDYPLIYAQQEPLTTNFPDDVQNNTDILVLQIIDSPQLVTSAVSTGDTSISRFVNSDTSAIASGNYMLIADDNKSTLLRADDAKTTSDGTVDLVEAINQNFPAGSTLYTDYGIKIVYIRELANGNTELYQMFYQSNNAGLGQVLMEGVSDLQISYQLNGEWTRVATSGNANDQYHRLWDKDIKAVRLNYQLNGEEYEDILSLNGVGALG